MASAAVATALIVLRRIAGMGDGRVNWNARTKPLLLACGRGHEGASVSRRKKLRENSDANLELMQPQGEARAEKLDEPRAQEPTGAPAAAMTLSNVAESPAP